MPGTSDTVELAQIEGLLQTIANDRSRFGRLAEEELVGLGAAAVPPLQQLAEDNSRAAGMRIQAASKLGTLGAWCELLTLAETCASAPVRHQAYYHLGLSEADWVVPRLCLRLKYEKDFEGVLWLAGALLRLGNGSGLPALFDLTKSENQEWATRAMGILAEAQTQYGLRPIELQSRWVAAPTAPIEGATPNPWDRVERSPALEAEVWRLIAQLSSEHFQLRGVDDARYTLARLGGWAAGPLALALGDADPYIRLHCAQVLERMGARALPAREALIELLSDGTAGPTAALALGALQDRPAADALVGKTNGETPLELRIAAIRALAQAGFEDLHGPVHEQFLSAHQTGSTELAAHAAATSWILQPTPAALEFLASELTGPRPAVAEACLLKAVSPRLTGQMAQAWEAILTDLPPIPNLTAHRARQAKMASFLSKPDVIELLTSKAPIPKEESSDQTQPSGSPTQSD